MTTIVTLKSVNEGLYTVEIKREFGDKYNRKFTKAGLDEYVEGLKGYCRHKGYEFIYREEITPDVTNVEQKGFNVETENEQTVMGGLRKEAISNIVQASSNEELLELLHDLIADIENEMDHDIAHVNVIKNEILARMK